MLANKHFDIAIIGLGAMGSAAIYEIARRGHKVLGLDKFSPPHTEGSSHGETRIIRQAYFEGEGYVPLLKRAYELWAELEASTGTQLFHKTGGLFIGKNGTAVLDGSINSAKLHQLKHEVLDAKEISTRWPLFKTASDDKGLFETAAGFLLPELCIESFLKLARTEEASINTNEAAISWKKDGSNFLIKTAKDSYLAKKLILSPGAWAPRLLDYELPLTVWRQVLYWFLPENDVPVGNSEQLPIYIWETGTHGCFYGFPKLEDSNLGYKIAFHDVVDKADPDHVKRTVEAVEIARMDETIKIYLPALSGASTKTATCMYTSTPDEHFVLGEHPKYEGAWIASCCSGHGFKFSSVIGEMLAELAVTGKSRHNYSMFSPLRFKQSN